ncbi:TIGR00730 family Rossman fold protein [Kocuria sp. JC486]|uniref:Cytokinin riboside 5'-monophosphate phosphoribohydrolase n=1 Tax=Kocuria soli TaxID=2485125 RepID=A0A3N4A2Q2_9MICC|nr:MULTISPECIES: TIGR00730 family Rossman fold protein [Kocuria]NHU85521.1 TIGR00730 family Rossman fold protein [Kocuria sp. JC486]ROZ62659.1 TIGR00730 family Rossman fold protein [Kocuria soli]
MTSNGSETSPSTGSGASRESPRPDRNKFRHKGPIILRGRELQRSTSDQRFLEPEVVAGRAPGDFTRTDPWRVLRIQSEFVDGFDTLARLGPAISVFGSARIQESSAEYAMAREVGQELGKAGYTVITGGGPGVMEAANRGAHDVQASSVGLGIELPHEQGMNPYIDLGINFRYFFVRKTMFAKYSQGFIVLPGGFGTMDELFESLTLVQTGKMTRFPVVLMGGKFWAPLVDWIKDSLVREGMISPEDLDLLYVTDSPSEAVTVMREAHERRNEELRAKARRAGSDFDPEEFLEGDAP